MIKDHIDKNTELKKAYGVEGLLFYSKGWRYRCKYVGNDISNDPFEIRSEDLDFLLKALSMQQGQVYFDDVGEFCKGLDEIKKHYLIMRLAGI